MENLESGDAAVTRGDKETGRAGQSYNVTVPDAPQSNLAALFCFVFPAAVRGSNPLKIGA